MPSANDRHLTPNVSGKLSGPLWRYAPLVVILVLIGFAYAFGLHRGISFETLIRHRAAIDQFINENELAAVLGFLAIYVAVVSLSLPCAALLTVTGGFLFGPIIGTAASCLGAVGGATVIFLVARSAAGEWLTRRAGPLAAKLAEGFRTDAFNYVLFLRLVPFPFWLVNLAAALFGVRLGTFLAATAIGIIPACIAFAVFGAGLDSVVAVQETQYHACLVSGRSDCSVDFDLSHVLTPTLIMALAAIGALALVPVLAKRFLGRRLPAGAPFRKS